MLNLASSLNLSAYQEHPPPQESPQRLDYYTHSTPVQNLKISTTPLFPLSLNCGQLIYRQILHLRLHVRIIPGLLANDPVAVHFHKPLGCLVTGGRLVTCVQVMGGRVTKPVDERFQIYVQV